MEYTQNYALRKPGLNEYANVGDLNFNADKIDSQMKKNQDVDGEVYDPTSTSANAYEAGDYVINPDDGLMYVCNGTTYGTWDSTKWDHTTEFEEIQKAMASGGESELADLHDVDITNPTDGQALLYDPTSSKWHNSDLPDADVTKTASGNPIEFEDGADAPLVKCVTQITGSQDLHGYDKPWVGGAGKNKWNGKYVNNTFVENDTWDSSTYNFAGNNAMPIKAGTKYTCSVNGVACVMRYAFLDSNKDRIGSLTNSSTTVYAPSNAVYLQWRQYDENASEPLKCQIEEGSTATSYAPYSNICPITAYTEGEIEVRGKNIFNKNAVTNNRRVSGSVGNVYTYNGYCVSNFIKVKPNTTYTKITGGESYFAFYATGGTYISGGAWLDNGIRVSPSNAVYLRIDMRMTNVDIGIVIEGSTISEYEPYELTTHTTTYPSAIYRGSEDCVKGEVTTEWGMIASYAGETLPGEWISDRDEYAPNTSPTTGAQVAYALATPATSSVTPTNLPIRTLSGYNHIESSTGEMEIEYFPAKEQPLIDLIKSDTIDTQEILYIAPDMNDTEITIDLTAYDEYVFYANDVVISSQIPQGNSFPKVVFTQLTANHSISLYGFDDCSCIYTYANGKLTYYTGRGGYKITMIVGIKRGAETQIITPSQQRSLKSAPQEETKEEQVEELKEEPTEETKEEPEEEVEEVKEEETKEEGEVNER